MFLEKYLMATILSLVLLPQFNANADNTWKIGRLENSTFDSKTAWGNVAGLSARYRIRSATSLEDGSWIAAIAERQSKEDSKGMRSVVEWRIIAAEVRGLRRMQLELSGNSNSKSRVIRIESISSKELLIVVEVATPTSIVTSVLIWNIPDGQIEAIEDANSNDYKRSGLLDFGLCFGKNVRYFHSELAMSKNALFESGFGYQNSFLTPDRDGAVSSICHGFDTNSAICASQKLEAIVGIEFGKLEPIWKIDRESIARHITISTSSKLLFWTAFSKKTFANQAPLFMRVDDSLYVIVVKSDGSIEKIVPTNLRYLASSPCVSLDNKHTFFFAYGDDLPTRHLASVDFERAVCTLSSGYSIGLCHVDEERVYGFADEGLVSMDRMNLNSSDFLWSAITN